jgi:hypothetical protein
MQLKISLTNQFRVLYHELCVIALMFIILCCFSFNRDLVLIFGIGFILATIPVFFLHFEYYLANRRKEIYLEKNQISIINNNGLTSYYSFDDLEIVIYYKSASMDKGGIPIMPIEPYHFIRIITKSKEQIIITCLMYPNLDKVVAEFNGVRLMRVKRGFCSLSRF